MMKTEDYLKDSAQQEKLNINLREKIKIIGSDGGIALIEEMITEMEECNYLEVLSKSEVLTNKGESRKRKFFEVNMKNVED